MNHYQNSNADFFHLRSHNSSQKINLDEQIQSQLTSESTQSFNLNILFQPLSPNLEFLQILLKRENQIQKDQIKEKIKFLFLKIMDHLLNPKNNHFLISKIEIGYLDFDWNNMMFFLPQQSFFENSTKKSFYETNLPKISQILILIEQITKAIRSNVFLEKREIYYNNIEHFNSINTVHKLIQEISFIIGTPRHFLKVLSSPKGLVYFSNNILSNESQRNNKQTVTLISRDIQINISTIQNVIIVEKETVFHHLVENGFSNIFKNCLLVTGKGYPDLITRHFLKNIFLEASHVPYYYLGDFDPHGIDIFLEYSFGRPIQIFENVSLPIIKHIGIFLSDQILFHNNNNNNNSNHLSQNQKVSDKIPLNIKDINKIHQILALPYLRFVFFNSRLYI